MTSPDHSGYVLGSSAHEQERLLLQGRFLRPYTERYLRTAGVSVDMRVLDVGCGIGDVALLAADIVGPGGHVTCVDRDATAIARAQQRVVQHGCSSRVDFHISALADFSSELKFDALIGRYILLYQPDPVTVLRHLLGSLKLGSIMAFHELDFPDPHPSYPPCPILDQVYSLIGEAFRSSGAFPNYGRRIGHTFLEAGLPFPTIACEGVVGGGRASYIYSWFANTLISIAPRLDQLGLPIPREVSLDHTLAALLEQEAMRIGSQILGPTQYGAWSRVT